MGFLDYDGAQVDVPNALARLSTNLDPRNYDSTGIGPGLDIVDETRITMNSDFGEREDEDITREIEIGGDRVRHVRHLSLAVFQRLLVNHFAILFSQNNIVWPRRYQTPQRRLLLTSN